MQLIRRLRGALGIALTWSLTWVPLGLLLTTLVSVQRGYGLIGPGEIRANAMLFAIGGFVCGLLFAGALTLLERRESLHTLRGWRVAAWGAIAAGAFPLALAWLGLAPVGIAATVAVAACFAAQGALSARATLALAQRGAVPAPERFLPRG